MYQAQVVTPRIDKTQARLRLSLLDTVVRVRMILDVATVQSRDPRAVLSALPSEETASLIEAWQAHWQDFQKTPQGQVFQDESDASQFEALIQSLKTKLWPVSSASGSPLSRSQVRSWSRQAQKMANTLWSLWPEFQTAITESRTRSTRWVMVVTLCLLPLWGGCFFWRRRGLWIFFNLQNIIRRGQSIQSESDGQKARCFCGARF